jgi:hypothetical protein
MDNGNGLKYDYTITIGSCGRGTWNSGDGGESWMHQRKWFVPPESPIVRALTVHPREPHTLYAGGDRGLHVSRDNGRQWEMLSPIDQIQNIWSVAIDPINPDTIYVGTSPNGGNDKAGVHRTRDGGQTWQKLELPRVTDWCEVGPPRVDHIAIDPIDNRVIFAGIEVDGLRRSVDGGDTWTFVDGPWPEDNPDHHYTTIIPYNGGTRVLSLFPDEIYFSDDVGESWECMGTRRYINDTNNGRYFRWLAVKPDDPKVMFGGAGNFNVGSAGGLYRTMDWGETWETLTTDLNSTVYGIHVNPANTDRVVAVTSCGQVWASEDSGDSWRMIKEVFGELLAVAWQPNSEDLPSVYHPVGMQAALGGGVSGE